MLPESGAPTSLDSVVGKAPNGLVGSGGDDRGHAGGGGVAVLGTLSECGSSVRWHNRSRVVTGAPLQRLIDDVDEVSRRAFSGVLQPVAAGE